MGDERLVGRRHRVIAQSIAAHPCQVLAFQGRHRSLPTSAYIERHQQMEIRIRVAGESERCEALLLDNDSQLLFKLAHQSILGPLTRIDLATRKFPQTGHRPAGWSLCDQYPRVRVHEGAGRDDDELHVHEVLAPAWNPPLTTPAAKPPPLPNLF